MLAFWKKPRVALGCSRKFSGEIRLLCPKRKRGEAALARDKSKNKEARHRKYLQEKREQRREVGMVKVPDIVSIHPNSSKF